MKNRNALIRCMLGVVVASAMLVVTWSTPSARFSYTPTPTTTTTTVGSSSKVAPPVLSSFTRIPFRSFLTPATIITDKSDYHPGERVTVTGSGFQAGETITLTFVEDPNH